MVIGRAPTRPAATVTGGGRQRRLLLRPRLQRRPSLPASAGAPMPPRGAAAPMPMGVPAGASRASAKRRSGLRGRSFGRSASRPCAPARPRPAAAGRPSSIPMPAQSEVDAWVQGGPAVQQPIVVPDRKMSRKARREAERAFAARAAAELEARQARRAQEAAAAQRSFGSTPARAAQLLRTPPQPAVLLRRSRPGPASRRCSRAYGAPSGRSRPPRALAVFPLRHFPKLKRASAEDAFGAGLFVMQLTCWASTPCRPPGIERRRARR